MRSRAAGLRSRRLCNARASDAASATARTWRPSVSMRRSRRSLVQRRAASPSARSSVPRGSAFVEQRPVAAVARALELLFDRRSRRYTTRAALARAARGCAASRTAPPPVATHDAVELRQLVDHLALALAEARLALASRRCSGCRRRCAPRSRRRCRRTCRPSSARELPADGGLARAHRADQKDVTLRRAWLRQDTETRRPPEARPSDCRIRRRGRRQSTSAPSRRIFGVTKISSSSLLLVLRLAAEQVAEARDVAEARHLVDRVAALRLAGCRRARPSGRR